MTTKNISVALSGSGFKFPAHVGAIKAAEEAGYTINELAGTSGGSIVAVLYSAGLDSDTLKTLALKHDWSNMMTFNFMPVIRGTGICSGNTMEQWLLKHTEHITFKDCIMKLTLLASDLDNMEPYIMSSYSTPGLKLGSAARASSSIPIIFSPKILEDIQLVDGAVVNNIPVDMLLSTKNPHLGVQLTSHQKKPEGKISGFADIATRSLSLMMDSLENEHISDAKMENAHMTFVETGYASSLDRYMPLKIRKRLYDDGYSQTKKKLAQIG